MIVLGIDAAWTATEPSGIAVIRKQTATWTCVGVAPSYASFIALSRGAAVDWGARPVGSLPEVGDLLDAVERLAGAPPDVVAVDMPLSNQPIVRRRAADDEISRRFGARGCAVHSPSATRPGPIADALRAAIARRGFTLATSRTKPGTRGVLLEVFPHTSVLRLRDADYRVPYKIARSRRYWPQLDPMTRRQKICEEWRHILAALAKSIAGINLPLPPSGREAELKRFEDAIDAVVCAWTGMAYLNQDATAHGDEDSAIWT